MTTQHIFEMERIPLSMRTSNIDHENNKTEMGKERIMPAPMVTGREILAESSRDEVNSQPSRKFASIEGICENDGINKG